MVHLARGTRAARSRTRVTQLSIVETVADERESARREREPIRFDLLAPRRASERGAVSTGEISYQVMGVGTRSGWANR